MKVHVVRTRMIGGGLSYDVEVPVSEVQNYDGTRYTTILRGSERYVNFVEATLPESHFKMPTGVERYQEFLLHKNLARCMMLDIAESVFPELGQVRQHSNQLPILWVTGLLEDETSAEFTVDVDLWQKQVSRSDTRPQSVSC